MNVSIESVSGAFKLERSGDINDMPLITILGYREARNWALAPNNHGTVLASLTSRGEPPVENYIDFGLYGTFCQSVWGQDPPRSPEFRIGFCLGVDEAVRQLRGSSAD